jgi:hypothetical protein
MEFLNSSEIYAIWNHKDEKSLCAFIDSEQSNFIDNVEKAEIKRWMQQLNYQHHNEANFFGKIKEIFTENGICYVKEGQEDRAAISLNNSVVVFRNSDFGVGINIIQTDGNDISPKNWSNFQKILSELKLGFINPKDFHLKKSFDKMNSEIEIKNSVKERKVKI